MRPLLLKGHERSITCVKYNREGDLLFSGSKHTTFAVWRTENGERLGTYMGHHGAVWSLDVDRNSEKVLSGAADTFVKLWDAESGKELQNWQHKAPVRAVGFALGDQKFVSVTDQVLGFVPAIYVWDLTQESRRPVIEIQAKNDAKILQAFWGPLNETIFTACEDGTVRVYDTKNGQQLKAMADHSKAVMSISFNKEGTLFITASKDGYCKLYDSKTFQNLKTYSTGRPVNAVSISPIKEEIIVGGGQSAETVTTTRVDSSQFKVRFFHLIYEEELGSVQGHFGPVNVLSYSPDGTGFASGGEDGYVRLHHFDKSYFSLGKD